MDESPVVKLSGGVKHLRLGSGDGVKGRTTGAGGQYPCDSAIYPAKKKLTHACSKYIAISSYYLII